MSFLIHVTKNNIYFKYFYYNETVIKELRLKLGLKSHSQLMYSYLLLKDFNEELIDNPIMFFKFYQN